MSKLIQKYRRYVQEPQKGFLNFKEFKNVNRIGGGWNIIVKSDDQTICSRVFKTNPKNCTQTEIANDIYEKLNNEQAKEYHVISVFITKDKVIMPYKFVTRVDKPEEKINEIINRVMFVYKPNPKTKNLEKNQNFLNFSITKGENTICRRFAYVDDSISDFTEAFELLDKHFKEDEYGKYHHDIKISYNITNELTDVDETQEFTKDFYSNDRIINVKEGLREMLKSFKPKNETDGEN